MTLHVHQLRVDHGRHRLVDVADVRLHAGRAVTIVGESGSGKSLLAHALMGTLPPELRPSGTLQIEGVRHDADDGRGRRRLWGRTLALLPQEPMLALDPTMRVGRQVAEGVPGFRRDRGGARARAATALAGVGLPAVGDTYPHRLSGGMAQRVAYAAATVGGAPVLLADEPSKGLDERARVNLAALLRGHVTRGGMLLTITHDLDLARALGGEVLVMRRAEIVERGPVEEVLSAPDHAYTRALLAAEPRHWDEPWMRAGSSAPREGEALVVAEGITKAYGTRTLFEDLAVTLQAGQRVAIAGPSGVGKTTLGNVLLRLLPADDGAVRHTEHLPTGAVQKLYQDPALAFPARVPLAVSLGDVLRRHRLRPARLSELVQELGLDEGLLARRPGQVSGGELQRLAIIRAMLVDPRLLFADEPTSRLDLVSQQQTVRALMSQIDGSGCALLLVTHDASLATAVADRQVHLGQPTQLSAIAEP
ncbi:ABC transporter ATP-binding protein [Egicoccus sp. AB-alg2]|uniref:ABC transporter ATP-binding protein n=1 Tax=Egicoccus sp. AB-alg2 TaxID=3242693 RepID=UPI00359EB038